MVSLIINLFLDLKAWGFRTLNKLAAPANNMLVLTEASADVSSEDLWASYKNFISLNIKKYPYWVRGHLEFASIALKNKEISAAYASAQAVLALKPSGSCLNEAKRILAACYLQNGEYHQAEETIKGIPGAEGDPVLSEDLAAIYLAAGKFPEAKEAFERIGLNSLKADARAAYDFVNYKLSRS